MIKVVKTEIDVEESLRKRLTIICDFCNTAPTIIKGSVRNFEKINISYIEPHRVIIKDDTFEDMKDNYTILIIAHRLSTIVNTNRIMLVGDGKITAIGSHKELLSSNKIYKKLYENGELVIDNDREYSQISNLDEILLQMVRIFNQSLDSRIVLDPYYFMLELTDEPCKDYKGKVSLVITEKAIRNQKLNGENFDEATKYFINRFLDHFIGWNFGLSVNRNEDLKRELEELNEKVIDMGIREWAGSGVEVHGVENEVYNGLQHYKLPTEKVNVVNVKKKSIK